MKQGDTITYAESDWVVGPVVTGLELNHIQFVCNEAGVVYHVDNRVVRQFSPKDEPVSFRVSIVTGSGYREVRGLMNPTEKTLRIVRRSHD